MKCLIPCEISALLFW